MLTGLEWLILSLFLINTGLTMYMLLKLTDIQVDLDMIFEIIRDHINKQNK